jgi:hypothetical protein
MGLSLTGFVSCTVAYKPSVEWWFPAAGLAVVAGGLGLSLVLRNWSRVFAFALVGLAALWTLGAGFWTFGRFLAARSAVSSGQAQVVEGTVTDFHPAPREGHEDESFTVNGVRFTYSDYALTGGFRQTASHGGPVRGGLHVKIHYVPSLQRNVIVKLEICPDH